MEAKSRWKRAKLQSILVGHAEKERRTMSDLRAAGFEFATLKDAYERLSLHLRFQGFNEVQIDAVLRDDRTPAKVEAAAFASRVEMGFVKGAPSSTVAPSPPCLG